jgi:hypothetical protein
LGSCRRTGAKISVKTNFSVAVVSPALIRMPFRSTGSRVGEVTLREYQPGRRWSIVKFPCTSVMTRSRLAPSWLEERESGPVRKTVAPSKGFPWESATEPLKRPYSAAAPGTAWRLRRRRLPARRRE